MFVKLSRTAVLFAFVVGVGSAPSLGQDGRISGRVTRPVGVSGSVELELALPVLPPNPLLKGLARLEFDPEEDPPAQSLSVSITEGGDFANSNYLLFIEDEGSSMQLVGQLEGETTTGEFAIDGESDEFENFKNLLGVDDFSQLQRRLLEIRVGGAVHLQGAVPIFASKTLCTAPNPNDVLVKGRIDVARRGTRSTINLRIEGVDVLNSAYGLFVETAVGSELYAFVSSVEPLPRRVLGDFDRVIAYSADTSRGDRLPLDVPNLDDLAGRRFFVLQDDDLAVAEGAFPAILPPGAPVSQVAIRSPLVRPTGFVPDSTARGFVELRRDPKTGRQMLVAKVFMRRATNFANGEGRLFFELTPGSRVFNEVGCFFEVQQANRLRLSIPIATQSGEALPLGALSLDDLTGRRMQVRDPGGLVYLEGFMPRIPAPGTVLRTVTVSNALTNQDPINFPSAECLATLRVNQRDNTVQLTIDTLGLRGGPVFEIWMTDPRTGQLGRVANLNWPTVSSYRVDTSAGEALPFGILAPEGLYGLALEIREQGGGLVLSGTLPNVP
ncbi:MAG: hypothetical protein JNM84_25310 [Planctomycetes bacterium]|nr:hypothetical protein [Planctomycetota bacterium]